jgi:hypothetical protein
MGLSELTARAGAPPGAGDGRRQPRLPPRAVLAAAVRAGRRDWRRILAVAIAVSLVSSGVEIVVDHFVDPSDGLLSAGASIAATGISLLGTVLLAGFVCRLISAGERLSLSGVARTLPWGRLAGADVLVSLIAVVGLVLLVVPGLVALTLLAVTGPVIEIEHRKVIAALRRSVRLTRAHPWAVLLLATLPLMVAGELEAIAPEPHHADEIVQFLVVRGLGEGIVEACIALILVELCFRLIDADAAAASATEAAGVTAGAAGSGAVTGDGEPGGAGPGGGGSVAGLPPTASGNSHVTT